MSDGVIIPASRVAARNAAILLLVGLFTGIYAGLSMSGQIPADPHTALAAHLSALLGAFWLLGMAWTLPMLRYGEKGLARLVWVTTGANFANWAVTAFKALWKVSGVSATGDARNDTIFAMLTAFVVLPSLGAASAWVFGFMKR